MKHMTTRRLNILRRITIGLALAVCISGLASIAASAADKAKDVKADVVYRNGFVYTVDGVRSRAEAFAVKDGKFIRQVHRRRQQQGHEGLHRREHQDSRSKREDGDAGAD